MCADLRRLVRLRLRRPDVSRAVSVPSVQQFLLHRWRADLSCTLAMGNAQVYMAALGAAVNVPVRAGGDGMRVYELQAPRV